MNLMLLLFLYQLNCITDGILACWSPVEALMLFRAP